MLIFICSYNRSMNRRQLIRSTLGTLPLFTGVGSPVARAQTAQRVLKVAVAASLVDVVRSMAKVIEKQRPGLTIEIEWGASDVLITRIANFALFDIVLLSDDISMSRLVANRKVSRARVREFATNSLAIVSKQKLTEIGQLAEDRFKRVAIGDPTQVPAGRYAREAMVLANVWAEVEPKLVLAIHVRQALEYVVRGGVDAAIVYRSDTIAKSVKGFNILPIQASVTHYVAPLLNSANPDDSAAFVEFVTSESARVALKQLQFQ
jgi:molybdate transport system substrate-binding protein